MSLPIYKLMVHYWLRGLLLLILTVMCFPSFAAERRVALVIGNASYADKPLRNTLNDAADIAAALKRSGFEIMERKNRTADQLRGDLSDFQDKLSPGAVGLFYFAGHGVQAGKGQNYLLPVGVTYKRERDAESYGLEVGSVLRRMEDAGASLSLVILDACRDSPLPAEGRSTGSRGLGRMEAPSGSMIAFATAPGSIADENTAGRNGLYTQHLLRAMETPSLRLEDVFKRVRRGVEKDSNRRQSPEEIMKLTSDEPFYFRSGSSTQSASAVLEPNRKPNLQDPEDEAWAAAKSANTATAYGAYLTDYPSGKYASAARIARGGNAPQPIVSAIAVTPPPARRQSLPTTGSVQERSFKFASSSVKGDPSSLAMEKFAELAQAKSGGKFKVSLFPASALGIDQAMVAALQGGSLEMAALSTGILKAQSRDFEVLDLPFLFLNSSEADAALDGNFGNRINGGLEPKGLVGLGFWEIGFRGISNSRRPIARMEDAAGLKLRVIPTPINTAWVKALGANLQALPFAEVYSALQTGVVDGQENTASVTAAVKFWDVQKYFTQTNHQYGVQSVAVSKKFWDQISDTEQKIIADALYEATLYQRTLARNQASAALDQLRKNGVQVLELSPAEWGRFRESTRSAVDNSGAYTVLLAELPSVR